jgi:preprotein translocase subunit YajC
MSLFGLIPEAHAQAASQGVGSGDLTQFLPFVAVIGIFYFLLIRPQQQKAKQLRNQLAQLKRGDSVITAGGLIGTVARLVNDNEVIVEIAEGVRVRVVRSTIGGITGKGEPRSDLKEPGNDDAKGDDAPAPTSTSTQRRGRRPAAAEVKKQS